MIQNKAKLQILTALSVAALIVALGSLSGYAASNRLRDTMERQMAEDSRVISENLRIIIGQVTQELADQGQAMEQVQDVLQNAQTHGWRGFACVVDEDGTVVAHPNPDMRGATVSLETYEPTALAGPQPVGVFDLPSQDDELPPGVYKSSSDIIAVQWLPKLMTYLCVHQPQDEIAVRTQNLLGILTRLGLLFVVVSGTGTWLFVGYLVDRYESSLEVSEARNRSLVQNSDAIVVIDDQDRVLHTNPAAIGLLGIDDQTRPPEITEFWDKNDLQTLTSTISEARSGKASEEQELELHARNGRTVPVALKAVSITYHDQEAIYLLLRDITETRRARDEILAANRKLKELDRLKSDFLNTVSHELRTPLTSIKWSTESLSGLNKNWDESTFEKLLRIIKDDNQRLTNLIEQLLSFSRLDAGQMTPQLELVDLKSLAEKVIFEMSPTAEAKQIDIVLSGDPAEIQADLEQMRLVISNLVDNAVKYSPPSSTVTLTTSQSDLDATISITDCGIGIKPEDLNSIFDRFFRSDEPRVRDEAGTGLGLAIVKGVAEKHEGRIDVRSTPGEGSTFEVELPIKSITGLIQPSGFVGMVDIRYEATTTPVTIP